MKKILYIHHGDINGGAPRSLKFLLERIDKNKYEPLVVYRCNKSDGIFFEETGTRTIYEPKIKPFHGSTVSGISIKQIIYNFVYAFPTYFATKNLIKEEHPDIIHINSTCLFMCAAASKRVNKSIKVLCHVREPLLPNFWGSILKYFCNRYCDRFVAIDAYDGHSVDPFEKKTSVIYNFVDFKTYNSDVESTVLRDELCLTRNDVIFLMLVRVSPENGILEIVSQWKELIHDSNAQLVIVGEIKNREVEYCRKCHEIADNVENIHILPFRKDAPQVIASSDVILCSFTQPHFARIIIEGAAMRKPAISVDIDGPRELIINGQTGYLYKNDIELKEHVFALMNDVELRERIGSNAEAYARKSFNADINAKATIDLYE